MPMENMTEQERMTRRRQLKLTAAAYNVGMTHAWFRRLPPPGQWGKVAEWVAGCFELAEERARERVRAQSSALSAHRQQHELGA